jgi:hypothetical protein
MSLMNTSYKILDNGTRHITNLDEINLTMNSRKKRWDLHRKGGTDWITNGQPPKDFILLVKMI